MIIKPFDDIEWQFAPDLDKGIFSCNIAFKIAKETNQSPLAVAQDVVKKLQVLIDEAGSNFSVKAVGPYINLYFDDSQLANFLEKEVNTINLIQNNQKLVLEYICANIAKPLHVGHILHGNYADALRRILNLKYPNIATNNYWGDWGVQFGILIWGWKALKLKQETVPVIINEVTEKVDVNNYEHEPVGTLVKLYVWANQQKDEVENWAELIRNEHLKLEQGDVENRNLQKMFFRDSQISVETTLKRLNIIPLDYNYGESSVEMEIDPTLSFIKKIGLGHSEGKGWYIDADDLKTEVKNFGRCYLVQSKDGYSTYALRDVAAKIMFAKEFKYGKYITFVGTEQEHHFRQVFGILNELYNHPFFEETYGVEVKDSIAPNNLGNIFNGMVNLPTGKMSSRKGNFLTADDILDLLIEAQDSDKIDKNIVANSAIKWFNLSKDIGQNSVLDIPTVLKFEGNTGVYQLYTYARLNSIIIKNSDVQIDQNPNPKWVTSLNSDEKKLLTKTVFLNPILENICQNHKIHQLTNHIYELSNAINSWYAKHSVSNEINQERKQALLRMVNILKTHLKMSLDLLGIEILEVL
jgi:arginyl-tRNA synthetase